MIRVLPRRRYFEWLGSSEGLSNAANQVGDAGTTVSDLRVVFGVVELREKVLAARHRLDDRALELLKVAVISEHPFLIQRSGLSLRLEEIADDRVTLVGTHRHRSDAYRVSIARADFDAFVTQDAAELESIAEDAFGPSSDHWVDMRRWSPRSWSLAALDYYARVIEGNGQVDTASPDFTKMLDHLPRGEDLASLARENLRILRDYVKGDVALEDALFEVRFGIELENEWGRSGTDTDITTLWELLRALPDNHVEGNTAVDKILIGTGPTDSSWFFDGDIQIDESTVRSPEFADTVRHEIGHAVEADRGDEVLNWLWDTVDWGWYDDDDAQIDDWLALMGGWSTESASEKAEVRDYLRHCLGPGESWNPPAPPSVPNGHIWKSNDYAPRIVFKNSPADWYDHYDQWHRANGYAFCLNYYYRQFMAVPETVLDFIENVMPYRYAAMSHSEFFAELYAAHHSGAYNLPAKYADFIDHLS